MCNLPWRIVGLFHSKVVPRNVVHVILVLVDCVETCVVPLVYTLACISRQPVFGNSTWWWFYSSVCLTSMLILDNALVWYLPSILHVAFPHSWPKSHLPPMGMWLVSTCATIGLECFCMVRSLWVPIVVPVAYWWGYPSMGGHTPPFVFHSIHIYCEIGSRGYIIWWSPLIGYQL